jgi:hypothetical protein
MTKTTIAIAAAAITLLSTTPALAGHHPAPNPPSTPPSSPTSVPEPTDAVLLLMGAAGVIIGRRLHARKKQR